MTSIDRSYSTATPGFIFHDSPGFGNCMKFYRFFMEEKAKSIRSRQSSTCYLVGLANLLATDYHHDQFCDERFCFVLDNARSLMTLETESATAGESLNRPISQIPD